MHSLPELAGNPGYDEQSFCQGGLSRTMHLHLIQLYELTHSLMPYMHFHPYLSPFNASLHCPPALPLASSLLPLSLHPKISPPSSFRPPLCLPSTLVPLYLYTLVDH